MSTIEISPFVEATANVFKVMMQTVPEQVDKVDPASIKNGPNSTAIIGLRGTLLWTLTINFPEKTGRTITQKLLQTDDAVSKDEISDTLGEVANMVAGGAKAELARLRGEDISLSLPTVITGQDYCLEHPKDSKTSLVSFRSTLGEFTIGITLSNKIIFNSLPNI